MDNPKLREYQKEDVEFLTKINCAGCFNEQRTGKTPTALATIKARHIEDKKIIVVTTSSALYTWKDEYIKWVNKPCIICEGTPKKKEKIIKEQWTNGLIISLDSLKQTSTREGCLNNILKQNPEMVILDEAHHIRNVSTWSATSMFKFNKIKYRLALTGTPAYGEPKDIYAILKFLYPEKFTSKYKFYNEYFIQETYDIYVGGHYRTIYEYKRFKPEKEKVLQNFLNTCCTQRKRKEVMKWLPEKDKQIIKLPLTKEQDKYLTELAEDFETETLAVQGVLDRLIRYRQICLDPELLDLKSKSPKTDFILNYIKENPKTPLLIFSNFTQYLKKLFNILKENNIKEAMICGETDSKTRNKYQEDFQSGKFNVFLINTLSGQEALTLDRAEVCIFTDIYPPIGSIQQAEDRFIATTEEKKAKQHTIYNLVMENSYDENIVRLLNERKTQTEIVNNFKEQILKRSKNE